MAMEMLMLDISNKTAYQASLAILIVPFHFPARTLNLFRITLKQFRGLNFHFFKLFKTESTLSLQLVQHNYFSLERISPITVSSVINVESSKFCSLITLIR